MRSIEWRPFPMTLSDLQPRFKCRDIIQRQIARKLCKIELYLRQTNSNSIERRHFQRK